MSNVENAASEQSDAELLAAMYLREQGNPTKLSPEQIDQVIETEGDAEPEDLLQAMLDLEQELYGEEEESEATEEAISAGEALSRSQRANNIGIVDSLDKSDDISVQMDAYAEAKLHSKIKPLWIHDDLIKVLTAKQLAACPEPDTVSRGMRGKVSSNNPDKYKVLGAGGKRSTTRSFWADEVHDRMAASQDLVRQISAKESERENAKGKSTLADIEADLRTLTSRRNSRVTGLKTAWRIWNAMRQCKEYDGVNLVLKKRKVKQSNGKVVEQWKEVTLPFTIIDKADPSNWQQLSIGQLVNLDFEEAYKQVVRAGEAADPYAILIGTLARERKTPGMIEIDEKNAIGVLTSLSLWSDFDKSSDQLWRVVKGENKELAKNVMAQIVRLHSNLTPFVASQRQSESRRKLAEQFAKGVTIGDAKAS